MKKRIVSSTLCVVLLLGAATASAAPAAKWSDFRPVSFILRLFGMNVPDPRHVTTPRRVQKESDAPAPPKPCGADCTGTQGAVAPTYPVDDEPARTTT